MAACLFFQIRHLSFDPKFADSRFHGAFHLPDQLGYRQGLGLFFRDVREEIHARIVGQDLVLGEYSVGPGAEKIMMQTPAGIRYVDIVRFSGHFRAVNTMTILLGATFALLLAAVVLSFQNMNDGVRNASPDELSRLRSQIDQLRMDQDRLQLEKQLQDVRANPVPQVSSATELEIMKAELAAKELEIAALAEEKVDAEQKADTYLAEAGLIGQIELERNDNELRRARMIRDALLIGRIQEYVTDPELGGFTTIEIVLPEHVQIGSILAIRRNTGILGKVKITDITPEGAIASPMPGFGTIDPQQGDELIIPPQV